ncbi:MAG: HEAT repeat domain-containing protein [Pirellulales bacterium]
MDISTWIDALSDGDSGRRADAAERLARVGDEARGAAVPLVRAAGDPDEQVRQWATAALEELGPPALEDGPALALLLTSEQADVAYWAATLLGRLADGSFVGELAAALGKQRPQSVRERACWALGRIGPPAREVLPALQAVSQEKQPRLARLARSAVDRIGG